MKYSVILSRPFVDEGDTYPLGYVARVTAPDEFKAIKVAIDELVLADREDGSPLQPEEVVVLWVFKGHPKVLIAEGTTCAENPYQRRRVE